MHSKNIVLIISINENSELLKSYAVYTLQEKKLHSLKYSCTICNPICNT